MKNGDLSTWHCVFLKLLVSKEGTEGEKNLN